jgi:hypothetical protein
MSPVERAVRPPAMSPFQGTAREFLAAKYIYIYIIDLSFLQPVQLGVRAS